MSVDALVEEEMTVRFERPLTPWERIRFATRMNEEMRRRGRGVIVEWLNERTARIRVIRVPRPPS